MPSGRARRHPRRTLRRATRNRRMAADPRAPRMLGADANADAPAPRDVANAKTAIVHVESLAEEIQTVLRQRDSHRHRQVAGTAAELTWRERGRGRPRPSTLHRARAAAAHDVDAVERIERADQHGRR